MVLINVSKHKLCISMVLLMLSMIIQVTSRSISLDDDYDDDDDTDEDDDISEEITTEVVIQEMRFTYGDDDAFGPLHWRNKKLANSKQDSDPSIKSAEGRSILINEGVQNSSTPTTISPKLEKFYANNHCQNNWFSPINIETRRVRTQELSKDKSSTRDKMLIDEEAADYPETLIVTISAPNIQHETWALGHPTRYHGIEIRSRSNTIGVIQLMDNFSPLPTTNTFTTFDFHFLSLFYCDLARAKPHRTMHQLDGKRFPLELEFTFLKKITNYGKSSRTAISAEDDDDEYEDVNEPESMSVLYDGEYMAVIVTVMGEVGEKDNQYFQPVVKAAERFHGEDFNSDDTEEERNDVVIDDLWSPTWLLPDSSDYYYYDEGSFPVPPCWSVARHYIMRELIQISQDQLDILTHIQTDREKNTRKMLPCTHSISILDNDTLVPGETPVNLNLIEYEMRGEDGKPRTEAEKQKRKERKRKREIFRKRLAGKFVSNEDKQNNDCCKQTMRNIYPIWLTYLIIIMF